MKQPKQRMPGRNRQSINFTSNNSAIIKSTKTASIGNTDTFGVRYAWHTLDPLNLSIVTAPVAAIATAFEFYRVLSCHVEFVPTGGFTQPGSLQWCFVANPELMLSLTTGTDTARNNIITNEQNVTNVSWAAGGDKRLDFGRVMARKWFSVNANLANTADDFDRTIQALFAYRAEGGVSTPVTGKFVFHMVYEFSGLGTSGTNTLSLGAGMTPRFPYSVEDGKPSAVVLYDRQGWEQEYKLPPKPEPVPTEDCSPEG